MSAPVLRSYILAFSTFPPSINCLHVDTEAYGPLGAAYIQF